MVQSLNEVLELGRLKEKAIIHDSFPGYGAVRK
jgi:hypothetical protein